MPPSSHCITCDKSEHLFYVLGNCDILSNFLSASNILFFALWMSRNISKNYFNMKFSIDITSSVTLSSFVTEALSHLFPLLSSSSCISRASQIMAGPIFSWSPNFIDWIHLCSIPTSLPALSLFVSCCTFTLVGQSFFQLPTSVKCHMGISLNARRQHDLLSVCELNRCTVTNNWQTLEEVRWLVTGHGVHLLFI